jgi:hypothetical protein
MTDVVDYVYVRLLNGDQLMATKVFENNEIITIECPMLIRLFPRLEQGGLVEQITSGPYCQFTDDRVFTFQKKDILFAKKLNEVMIPHYERMLAEHETEEEEAEVQEEKVDPTVEDIAKSVDLLHSIFERARKRKDEKEQDSFPTIIPGNETKH